MRGHVEQLSVTANQRTPLRTEPRETKGNKEMKHKHKPPEGKLHHLRPLCGTGDVWPHYIVITPKNLPKSMFIVHYNVMFALVFFFLFKSAGRHMLSLFRKIKKAYIYIFKCLVIDF